ncbi:hypothetical protein ACOBQB_21795 [Streptomyces sp. G5(2025)]|uniref:hypothetical protein n=1 Tax=Streptomyces sp. G5(2025) TaxID=3406628 RepID=UPI003C14E1CB
MRRKPRPACDRLVLGLEPERGVPHRRSPARRIVAEVERLTTELAALGPDSVRVGRPVDREDGLREFDLLGGRGFISFLPVPRHERVYVRNITWYG